MKKIFFLFFFWGGGGEMGNNSFLKQIFLGGNEILGTKFWRTDSCEEEISPAKIFWRNFYK